MTRRVYLDHHATTPMDPRVVEAMLPYFTEQFGNPGSVGHVFGEEAWAAVDASRSSLARILQVTPAEVVFTSGATESNNLAIRGVAERFRQHGGHFISVTTEHKAVLDPMARLEKSGFTVTLLSPRQVGEEHPGWLDPQQVADAIEDNTRLVSVMLVNNEIGVIQDLEQIASLCHQRGVLLHCDATQALGKMPVHLADLDIDMMSCSGHKIYGPRGMGALIIRRRRPRIKLVPLLEGGGQEDGRRSGTLNVPGIVGLATACELAVENMAAETTHLNALRDRLWGRIRETVPDVGLNGPPLEFRVPGNLNLHVRGVDGEALMMNMREVAVSSGSACTSANPEPSHVLRAIGLSEDLTRSSLRFGLGRFNTEQDIDIAAATLSNVVARLRSLS